MIRSTLRMLRLATLAGLALTTACGSAPQAGDPADPAGPAAPAGDPSKDPGPSPTAPVLVSVTPALDAQGVRADAAIVFVFSEPMSASATESAYASVALPADQVSFSWNGTGDTLTITPKSKLAYAVGQADVVALKFEASIGTGASARSGAALAKEAIARFSTLRQVAVKAPLVGALSGSTTSSSASDGAEFLVGDNTTGTSFRAHLAFSLDAVPDGAEVVSSIMTLTEQALSGAPDAELGALSAVHVYYETFDSTAYGAEIMDLAPTTRTPATVSSPASRSALVREMVIDDLANRAARQGRAIFRLQYATAATADGNADRVQLDPASPALEIIYLTK